jgi:hypothetical protein
MEAKNDSKPIRILPLGDSITYDHDVSDIENPRPVGDRVAYRFPLYRFLKQSGLCFIFVGNRRAGYNYFTEANNAGFPGCTVKELYHLLKTGYNQHEGKYEVNGHYLDKFKPDVILLHIGTSKANPANAEDVESILKEIRKFDHSKKGNPVTTFLARIINSKQHNPAITEFNMALDKIVEKRTADGDKIILVDMEHALDYNKDMADMMHPNPAGDEKIARQWHKALMVWLDGQRETVPATVQSAVNETV